MGICHSTKQIVSIKSLKSKRILGAIQDGSREFLSLLASICADGSALPPALIYQGKSRDMQDTWLDDFDAENHLAYFAASSNGWSNDEYGLVWLEQVFDRHTKAKAEDERERRLLIVDGHSSHVNMKFIDYADRNRILLVILPPHSTHRLQPLDVGVFSPLAKAYSQQVDEHLRTGFGYIRMTKRDFWKLFYPAWSQALTAKNIALGFAATGIHSLQPDRVLDHFNHDSTPPSSKPPTPTSARALRHALTNLQKDRGQLELILRASEKLAFKNEILLHENRALVRALNEEKKRRKRGKALGLLNTEESAGKAQFWSPSKVAAARQHADEEKLKKQEKIAQTEANKLQRAIRKEQKAREALERKAAREKAQIEARDRREREKAKAEREQQRAAKKLAKEQAKEQKKLQQQERAAKQQCTQSNAPSLLPVAKQQRTRCGRITKTPK